MCVHKLQERSASKKKLCFKTPTACQSSLERSAIVSSYSYIRHWLPSSTLLSLPTLSNNFLLSSLGCHQPFFSSSSLAQHCSQSCSPVLYYLFLFRQQLIPHPPLTSPVLTPSTAHKQGLRSRNTLLRSSCFLSPSNLIADSFRSVCFLLQHSKTPFCFSVTPSAYISEYFLHTV